MKTSNQIEAPSNNIGLNSLSAYTKTPVNKKEETAAKRSRKNTIIRTEVASINEDEEHDVRNI